MAQPYDFYLTPAAPCAIRLPLRHGTTASRSSVQVNSSGWGVNYVKVFGWATAGRPVAEHFKP